MCIIFDDKVYSRLKALAALKKDTPITVWKVYRINGPYSVPGQLQSPYNRSKLGGRIDRHGEYIAENRFKNAHGRKVCATFDGENLNVSELRKREKTDGVNAYGFHCFLNREGAEALAAFRNGNAFPPDHVVVPLKVKLKDMIVAGHEEIQVFGRIEYKLHETATFKRIRISRSAYKKAISCA